MLAVSDWAAPNLAGGFLGAQVGVVSVWMTHSLRGLVSRGCWLLAATLVLGLVHSGMSGDPTRFSLAAMGVLVACNVAAALIVRLAIHGRQVLKSVLRKSPRFSIGLMLMLMMLVAGITTSLQMLNWGFLSDSFARWVFLVDAAPTAIAMTALAFLPVGRVPTALLIILPGCLSLYYYCQNDLQLTDSWILYGAFKFLLMMLYLITNRSSLVAKRNRSSSTRNHEQPSGQPAHKKRPSEEGLHPASAKAVILPLHFDRFA